MTSDETGLNASPGTFVWYPCSDDNGLAESFGVPGFRGYLPFLLDEYDSSTEPEEKHLLLGILYGWPQLNNGKAISVPNDRDQNDILEILLGRLIRGFGWTGEAEMTRDIAPYILGQFGGHVYAEILGFMMMRIGEPDLFVTWCVLMWDLWLQAPDEDILNRLFSLIVNLVPDGFSGVNRDWIRLMAYAIFRFKGNEEHVEDWVRQIPGEDEITNIEIKAQFRKLAALDAVNCDTLISLGSAPAGIPDRLIIDLQDLYQYSETFPDFDPTRVITNLSPQRHLLSYTYHPKTPTANEAFGVEVKDIQRFLEDLVNMAATFHKNSPGGDFLQVDAARRLLSDRKDGGGILMTLAWQRIEVLVGESIGKALAGTLFEDRPE
jgi:hypothetical protein